MARGAGEAGANRLHCTLLGSPASGGQVSNVEQAYRGFTTVSLLDIGDLTPPFSLYGKSS